MIIRRHSTDCIGVALRNIPFNKLTRKHVYQGNTD